MLMQLNNQKLKHQSIPIASLGQRVKKMAFLGQHGHPQPGWISSRWPTVQQVPMKQRDELGSSRAIWTPMRSALWPDVLTLGGFAGASEKGRCLGKQTYQSAAEPMAFFFFRLTEKFLVLNQTFYCIF